MILIVSEIVPVKSAGDLEDKSQTSKPNAMKKFDSKRNAMFYFFWGKQNLKKFDSKRNAKFYFFWGKRNLKKFDSKRNAKFYFFWGKRNLKKFDSSSKEN
ncbi:hypothetical protein ABFA07_015999 [Porites harrisoni]